MDQASRAVRLVDRGQFKSIRQVSSHRASPDPPFRTDRWPPTLWTRGGQTRSFDEISRGDFGQIYTQYPASICPSQSRATTRRCGDVGPVKRAQCTPQKELALSVPRSLVPLSPECPHWRWGFTAKGWTNNEHTIEWVKEVFIP
jgi:hypothetical protein